jgi:hypothetical protein
MLPEISFFSTGCPGIIKYSILERESGKGIPQNIESLIQFSLGLPFYICKQGKNRYYLQM